MTRERWHRRGDETVPFDRAQARRASELGVPRELAYALHVRATRQAVDPADAEALYLRYLREAAARRSAAAAQLPVPGRQTRVLDETVTRRSAETAELPVPGRHTQVLHGSAQGPAPLDLAGLAPGRWTRVQLEYPAEDERPPGFDEVQGALGALAASRAYAPTVDPGAPDARARGSMPAAAPSLRRVPGGPDALDGAPSRAPGAPLPADLASRLAPHVGRDAATTARLHTDDTADRIAAAHQARALTLGVDIFFARDEYAPGTARGDELLVHELTHVAQARRGELTRAAAKGIASGGTLDPSEAEADLRARLAVIELHPPDGAAPPLAQPQGQPASDGERSTRLAGQQQRLGLAGQAEAPLTVPPAPPATSPEAPVPHPAPQMAQLPAPAPIGNAYVDALSAPPSKQGLELWARAGARATTQAAADQTRFDAALPPMPAVLDGGAVPGRKRGAGGGHAPAPPPVRGAPPPAAQPSPTPPAPAVTTAATAAQAIQPTAPKAQLKTDGQKLIDDLPTTAPDVKTDPGPAPLTDLAGQADPVRSIGDHQHAIGEGAKALDAARTKIVMGPGSAQVQPVKLDEKLHVPKEQATGAMPPLPTVEGMTKLKQWNLPGNALAAFDTVARPKMDAGLAQARAKMTEADTRRDADRDRAVSDAQGKVKQLHTDADQKQQARIADTRSQIANHQADTLVKHETEIKKFDAQSGDRKKTALGKINDRIAADQVRAETDYKAAQQQAEDKKRQGEDEARKKKQEAQNKKQDESWWNQATDALCDAIKSIADEIDKVLDAIGQAIGQILDAVKDAACKAIDAARDFVCQALTEFGDWLKSQVDALIGSVFPELAAALDRLIDDAVNLARIAVNAIADGLKQAVSALCDSIKASLDGIIAAFKAAVQAAATFAQAAVTGNWALVGKMILDGILNALGIDPAAFYALISEAEDSIEKIVQNPGAFVGHLIDAVKLGFQQFGANFWTHLKDGLVQWLFGTFAQAGITMPASFDIAGIFDLVCQILGLTWPRLRGKVVKLIGEKNTERLEFVGQYVQALITGGFAGLWQKIQGDLSNLWDMVVGGIRDWLIQSVVMAAIEKIATMWNPAGAIFELIKTAWNVYQWVRENAQRIFGLVQAVVHSISNIVAGNIGGAANFIESSLARLVPVAISLFADLLGLGGLAEKIKSIIEKVQEKVDHAIDSLIERVMKLFKGKGGKDGKDGKGSDPGDPNHKDDDQSDHAAAQRAATSAAEHAWEEAHAATTPQVIPEAQLHDIFTGAGSGTGDASHSTAAAPVGGEPGAVGGEPSHSAAVTVKLVKTGTSWSVEAHATVGEASATATQGQGWIATGLEGKPWFAGADLSAFNHELIDEAKAALGAHPPGSTEDTDGKTTEQRYQAKVEQAKQIETGGQERLQAKIRGLTFSIKLTLLTENEAHPMVKAHFQVAPNTIRGDEEYPLDGASEPVKAIAITTVKFEPPYTPSLIADLARHGNGDIYTAGDSDMAQLAKAKASSGAAFDRTTETLTLPSVKPESLKSLQKVSRIGEEVGKQTYAYRVTFESIGPSFVVKVGFDSLKVTPEAVTGLILLTAEQRLAEFLGKSDLAEMKKTSRYKSKDGTITYAEASSPFRNEDYVAYFKSAHPEQKLRTEDATSDLDLWKTTDNAPRGRLSTVGTSNSHTYIIVLGTFSETIIDTQAGTTDPALHDAVLSVGIVPFMKEMANGATVGGINRESFTKLWREGDNARWLAGCFRTYAGNAGKHEWIPSSAIPKTIDLAAEDPDPSRWLDATTWIDLHHEMRANTQDLIGKPKYWIKHPGELRPVWRPQGHDGAVEHDDDGAQSTGFGPSGPFHQRLFASIEKATSFAACIDEAEQVFIEYIWYNEEPETPLDPKLKIRGKRVTKISIEELMREQEACFEGLMNMFRRLKGKYSGLP